MSNMWRMVNNYDISKTLYLCFKEYTNTWGKVFDVM